MNDPEPSPPPSSPRRYLDLVDAPRRARAVPRALPAFRHYRPREGHPDWPSLALEASALAGRLLPSLDRPDRRVDLRRRARSAATAAGNFVENRRRARAGREDLLPLYFIWTTHRACNFACSYCDDHRGRRYPDLPDDDTLDTAAGLALLRVMRTRCPAVYLAGGEPTLRKDLPTLVRAARDLDYHPIIVNTNGSALHTLLARPAWRAFLADVDVLVVSLDALDLDLLAGMWATPRPEDVVRNLLLLRALAAPMRFKLAVNTVIQPGRVAHARDVLDLANDLGIWFSPVPMNTGPRIGDGLLGDPEYRDLVATVLARKRAGHRVQGSRRLNERLLRAAPLDCRNTLKPHVDHDGALLWPCKAAVDVAPARVRVLDFDHVDALYAHARARIEPAGFQSRCGAACNWAQNYTTDAYAHGLAHPASLLGEVAEFLRRA